MHRWPSTKRLLRSRAVYVVLGNIRNANFRRASASGTTASRMPQAHGARLRQVGRRARVAEHFAESAVRAYKIAMTPPTEPVVLVADAELQERPIPADAKLHIPKLTLTAPPRAIQVRWREACQDAGGRGDPLIVAGRRSPHCEGNRPAGGTKPRRFRRRCFDQRMRVNFPTKHPLFWGRELSPAPM